MGNMCYAKLLFDRTDPNLYWECVVLIMIGEHNALVNLSPGPRGPGT